MRRHLENAACGLLDYAAYPIGMLIVAPIMLRALGPAPFGIWAFAAAAVNTGAILASGFGDANIQQIALARSSGDDTRVEQCIRTTLSVHLLLGFLLGTITYIVAPEISQRVGAGHAEARVCVASLRIAGAMILFRAVETVVVSTQRAFERYSEAVRISASVRVLSLVISAVLAVSGLTVSQILAASGGLLILGTVAQYVRLCRFVSVRCLIPQFHPQSARALMKLGALTWTQSAAAAIFTQVDRLVVGVECGSVAVGAYTLCIQIAQPISGAAASALHFTFPYFARTSLSPDLRSLRVKVAKGFVCNLLLVGIGAALLLCFGSQILRVWAAPVASQVPTLVLPFAVLASASAGLAVTGTYAMLAFGRAGTILSTTLASGAAMLSSMNWLWHHFGITGVAASRLIFGLASLAIYIALFRLLNKPAADHLANGPLQLADAGEGS